MSEQVDILLATYQGASYLEEQLESIFTQTHPYFHLWIRDDNSFDETKCILQKWAEAYPQKITLIPSKQRLGAKGNFSELMRWSQAPYIMFADQDDKWLPHKVEASLNQFKAMERQYGFHLPLLIHTDLKVVDQKLKNLSSSFCRYTGINPRLTSLNRLLSQNVLTGCTLLMNRSLLELAYPIPEEAMMHDWWIGLVAACFGHIQFFDEPTLLYRQHAHNDTGVKRYSLFRFLNSSSKECETKTICRHQTYRQAKCLFKRYEYLLSSSNKALLKAYEELGELSYFKKQYQVLKYQFFKQGFLRNARLLLTR